MEKKTENSSPSQQEELPYFDRTFLSTPTCNDIITATTEEEE